jgi:hypothetical protein
MISLHEWHGKPPEKAEKPVATPAPIAPATRLQHTHRPLPGGGRIFVTLSDGTAVGMIRYDLEQKENLNLLLRAFASVVEERVNRAEG